MYTCIKQTFVTQDPVSFIQFTDSFFFFNNLELKGYLDAEQTLHKHKFQV